MRLVARHRVHPDVRHHSAHRRRWGKGAYCGWICSCGALAETLGDAHRQKMPHGPFWNRLNMVGQAILAVAFALFVAARSRWTVPSTRWARPRAVFYEALCRQPLRLQLNYYHVVDISLAGIVGVGLYFWFSGRVWCRFACPLAALMHIYARFSQFRIFADKKKCISCNVCTSVCHQGIDIMNFANKGLPMEDPSACAARPACSRARRACCSFGRYGTGNLPVLDRLPASPVLMLEASRKA